MIRTHWMSSAAAAKKYYRSSDYYASTPGEWLGKGAALLGLTGTTSPEQFDSLADNLDPRTGTPLTARTVDGRRVGLDMTFNSTKSVGIARELAGADNAGDPRIEQAHREAVAYTVGYIEKDMQARVRIGGANENRTTGNLVAYRVTHRDTRISAEDSMPDMSLHDHVFIFNATFDPVERKWKAAEIGQLKHDAPYYEAMYHNRLASNIRTLGYGVRRKDKAFEVAGISDDLVKKFSRRSAYIKAVAEKLGIKSPASKDKLGATTRLGKAKELADDLNGYYVSRLTDEERQQLTDLKGQPSYLSSELAATRFAIGHLFERQSVVEERKLYETAIRHGIGSVTPEGIQEEAKRQEVLLRDGDATTRGVLEEEGRIIAFAREGRGTMRPLAAPDAALGLTLAGSKQADTATLPGFGQQKGRPDESRRPVANSPVSANVPVSSRADISTPSPESQAVSTDHFPDLTKLVDLSPEQAAVARHVWDSTDQVILIRGAAGTGKTHTTKTILAGIARPYAVLAPTAEASRGVLRREGFEGADTVAAFLGNRDWQTRVKNGVIWVDEAGLLPIRDLSRLADIAKSQNARLVLMGDPKQHKSVARHGNMFNVLQEYAGLPVGELRDIRRQRGKYKEAVAAIDKGDLLKAHDMLDELGYIREVDAGSSNGRTPDFESGNAGSSPAPAARHGELVDDYMATVNSGKSVLVVSPTHAEGDEITEEIRERLKDEGKLGHEEKEFTRLVPLNLSEAEKADPESYEPGQVVQFIRSAGSFKAGQRVPCGGGGLPDVARFGHKLAVYREGTIGLATGDTIRVTAAIKDTSGKRIDNGAFLTVTGFADKVIRVRTASGQTRFLKNDVGHITHGYVSTSHAAQGKTVDVVLGAMGHESLGAISAEQFYVTASRGRERFTLYTDAPTAIRDAIQRHDKRRSATEMMNRNEVMKPDIKAIFYRRRLELQRRLRRTAERDMSQTRERERRYGR